MDRSIAGFTFDYIDSMGEAKHITIWAKSRLSAFNELERKNPNWKISWN